MALGQNSLWRIVGNLTQLRLSPRQTKGPRRRGGAGVFPFRHEPPRAATVARSALRAAKGGWGGLVSLTDEARPRRIPGSAGWPQIPVREPRPCVFRPGGWFLTGLACSRPSCTPPPAVEQNAVATVAHPIKFRYDMLSSSVGPTAQRVPSCRRGPQWSARSASCLPITIHGSPSGDKRPSLGMVHDG